MVPALQTVHVPKGLQEVKTERVEEMYVPARWGEDVEMPLLSPQAVVPPCLAVRKQWTGIAADQLEEWGMQYAECDLHPCAVALSLKKEVAAVTTNSQLPDGPCG